MIDWIQHQFATNEFFSGAVSASVVAVLLTQLRSIPAQMFGLLRKYLTTSVGITDDNAHFTNFSEWIRSRKEFSDVKTVSISGDHMPIAPGTYLRLMGWRPVYLSISESKNENGGWTRSIVLTSFDTGKSFVSAIVKEYLEWKHSQVSTRKFIRVYQPDQYDDISFDVAKRPMESVFVDDDVHIDILEDVRKFLGREDQYVARGIPHKRCFILNGPPGCGKTSTIKAIASQLDRDIAILPMDCKDSQFLSNWNNFDPTEYIIVLEDIDVLGNVDRDNVDKAKVSLSMLLNCIDGMYTRPGTVVFMTTNCIEKLDAALVRPGRTDRVIGLGNVGIDVAKRMADSFSVDWSVVEAQYGDKDRFNPAMLQEFLVQAFDVESLHVPEEEEKLEPVQTQVKRTLVFVKKAKNLG